MEKRIINAYHINELPGKVRTQIIQNYIDTHDWDNWKHERNKSFMAICDLLVSNCSAMIMMVAMVSVLKHLILMK